MLKLFRSKKIFLCCICFSFVFVGTAGLAESSAQVTTKIELPEAEFIRLFDDGKHKALQVAISRYAPRQGGDYYVDLISAVHVADRQYFHDLNVLFADYDAVLYELVAPEGTKIPKGGRSEGESKSVLSMVQVGMKNMLGLSFQLEEIDYTPKHFVHADMSPSEFSKSMEDRGESIFGMMIKMWRASIIQQVSGKGAALSDADLLVALFSANREHALKSLFATEFANMDGVLSILEGKEGSTLLTERNKKALQVFKRELQNNKKSLAIFYGAAHMPDFARRLESEFDLVQVSEKWVDAWNLVE